MSRLNERRAPRLVILFFAVTLLQACKADLYSGLQERQANQMISALARHGIAAGRQAAKDGSLTVTVDDGQFAAAVQVLEAAGLPEAHYASLGDVFKGNGLVASPMQERAQYVYAMSQELSNTVSNVDGIRSARVHVDLAQDDSRRNPVRASAAVFVRYEPDAAIEPLIPKIKSLVAGSISGLDYESVSVIPVAASVAETQETPRMSTWMGVPVPEKSAAGLSRVAAIAFILTAALAVLAGWWGQRLLSRGMRLYRRPAA